MARIAGTARIAGVRVASSAVMPTARFPADPASPRPLRRSYASPWVLWIAMLLLPLAQFAAGVHGLSHLQPHALQSRAAIAGMVDAAAHRPETSSHGHDRHLGTTDCASCVAGASILGGAMPARVPTFAAVPTGACFVPAVSGRCGFAPRWPRYRGRAPPVRT